MACGPKCQCQCVKPRKRRAKKTVFPRHNPIADLVTALLTQKIQEPLNNPPTYKPEPLEKKTVSTSTTGTMTEQSIRQSMGIQTEPERVTARTQTEPERISAEIQTEPEKAVARTQTEPETVTTEIQTEPEKAVGKTQTRPETVTTEIQTEPERVSTEILPRLQQPEIESVVQLPASEVQLEPELAVRRKKQPLEPYYSKAAEKSYNEEVDLILKERRKEEKERMRLQKEKEQEEKKQKQIEEQERLRQLVAGGGKKKTPKLVRPKPPIEGGTLVLNV